MTTFIKIAFSVLLTALTFKHVEAKNARVSPVEIIEAQVVSCHDGDTCRFNQQSNVIKVRFWGIDAPEKKQEYGAEARLFTLKLLEGKTARLECLSQSFDRKVCKIFVDGKMVQRDIVAAGMAWDEPKFSKGEFALEMKKAQREKIGLFKNIQARRPSQYRRDEK